MEKLIEHTKKTCERNGIQGYSNFTVTRIFIVNSVLFQAEEYGIGTSDNMYAVSLQAFELYQGALSECKGCFHEGSIFEIDPEAAEEYDKNFPYKEKKSGLPTQDRFQQLVGMRKLR